MPEFMFYVTWEKSILRQTSASHLKTFQWSKVVDELHKQAPEFSAILEASVKRYRKQHPRKAIIPSIGFAGSVLLRERNNFMCAAQCVNSILFHQGHASKMVRFITNMEFLKMILTYILYVALQSDEVHGSVLIPPQYHQCT